MTVFADAFFYVALINRHDSYHLRLPLMLTLIEAPS
jgi:hypothetical protein